LCYVIDNMNAESVKRFDRVTVTDRHMATKITENQMRQRSLLFGMNSKGKGKGKRVFV